jgi:two-component system sensor histidine kinase DctS
MASSSSLPRLTPLWVFFKSATRSFTDRRISLWIALVGLVVALLVTLVWLAGRYEASQYQAELDRDTSDAVSDIRSSFGRHVLSLQSLQSKTQTAKHWQAEVANLLNQNHDWLRIERRDAQGVVQYFSETPFRAPVFEAKTRLNEQVEIMQTCLRAKRLNGPAYSRSYFLPQPNGLGLEVMELCLPIIEQGGHVGYTLLTYGLQEILSTQLGDTYGRRNEISFIEPDGTRLAIFKRS